MRVQVAGTVEPVAGALVTIRSTGARAITDSAGAAHFRALPAGADSALTRLIGFAPVMTPVHIRDGEATEIVVALLPTPERLEEVMVSGRLPRAEPGPGFARRREMGIGHFITRSEIEKQDPSRTSDLFRRIPGVRLASLRGGHYSVVMNRGTSRCRTQFYVDGVPMTTEDLLDQAIQERNALDASSGDGGSAEGEERARARMLNRDVPSFTVDQLQPDNVEAIEVYKGVSEVPPEYNRTGTAMCGVVLIWTRKGQPNQQ